MKTHIYTSMKIFVFSTIILGIVYPLSVTLVAQLFYKNKANGSLIEKNGVTIGSELIAQKFTSARYFWPRPSASDYGAVPSGASNLGPTSDSLKRTISERKSAGLIEDLLFSSGSGLDPHISMNAALGQVPRIVQSRVLGENQALELKKLVLSFVESRDFGFLGEERINVLKLNLALDQHFAN